MEKNILASVSFIEFIYPSSFLEYCLFLEE